jgi:hypothetical protein
MAKLLGLATVLMGMATALMAAGAAVPEIDGSTTVAAVALVAGGILVIRARRKK